MNPLHLPRAWLLALLLLGIPGCGGGPDAADSHVPSSPKEAASALERTFETAPTPIRANAQAAAVAMREGDLEKAVISLQSVKAAPNVSLDQGLAIHGSMVSLEARLIAAMEAGDPRAKRAYEILKQMKRN
jgi:hypothetical protein